MCGWTMSDDKRRSNVDEFRLGHDPKQLVCPTCHSTVITDVRREYHCGVLRCSFWNYKHYCPVCDCVVRKRYNCATIS